jgi:uncharacterized protein (DUF1697 family)
MAPRTTRYVALLRGINVGGKNLVAMSDLQRCFEKQGHADVATYIQSGNVLFTASGADAEALAHSIERALTKTFRYDATVVLRSLAQMRAVVKGAPRGFGSKPALFRYDVCFLKEPLEASEVIDDVPVREGVDEVHAGRGVLYTSRVAARATQSRLSRIASMPVYQRITIRNWNTTTKLLSLLEAG